VIPRFYSKKFSVGERPKRGLFGKKGKRGGVGCQLITDDRE
jgi:hypothetical protein